MMMSQSQKAFSLSKVQAAIATDLANERNADNKTNKQQVMKTNWDFTTIDPKEMPMDKFERKSYQL